MTVKNKHLTTSLIFFWLFLTILFLVLFFDRAPIGPNESMVGLSSINKFFSDVIGCNMTLYLITDWASILPCITPIIYAVIGLIQWIKRKSIKRVDKSIKVLGVFYTIILFIYLFFNWVVINRRPVLINGFLEPSFPSSTTLMSITFLWLSNIQIEKMVANGFLKKTLKVISFAIMLFLVIGRIISGVHWITDIIASVFLSIGLVFLYLFLTNSATQTQSRIPSHLFNPN